MAARFRSTRQGPSIRLAPAEALLLRMLFEDLLALLDERRTSEGVDASAGSDADPLESLTGMVDGGGPSSLPDDPILARLLPDAYREDEERAVEFRRFTEVELRAGKQGAIKMVLDSLPEGGGRLLLAEEATADAWLGALNDLRLALGTRLDVHENTYDELEALPPESERARLLSVFAWLGYLQETLVDTLS